ncbi:MAG: carboxypeptidase-like regulatory domain-containing protein [Treponema sp.]|nr:carboxypeptidase-like regulatory domain-containing protein [Treponema sp.]
MKKVFNFRTVMVTVFAVAVAILAPSCSLIFSDDDRASSSDFGTIRVDFGENSRAITQLNSSTVSNFHVSVTNGTDVSKGQDVTWGGSAEFADLAPGSYTVTADAYMGDAVVQRASATVTVTAGQTANANLSFVKKSFIDERFVMPRNNPTSGKYYAKIYDSFSDVEFQVTESDLTTNKLGAVVQDMNGNSYYLDPNDEYKLKKVGDPAFAIPSMLGSYSLGSAGCLSYDYTTDSMYIYGYVGAGNLGEIGKFDFNSKTLDRVGQMTFSVSANLYNVTTMDGFAVEGDKVIIGCQKRVFYGKLEAGQLVKISEKLISDYYSDFGNNATISDVRVYDEGKAAIIVYENGASDNFGRYDISDGGTYFSRGAVALFNFDGEMKFERQIGWYNKSRHLTQKGTFVATEDEESHNNVNTPFYSAPGVVKNITLYGPSVSDSGNYFYGPKKIVCIKPKELYIVDEGVDIKLADWTKVDGMRQYYTGKQKGLTGNIFVYSRVVKVSLFDFAIMGSTTTIAPYYNLKYSESNEWYDIGYDTGKIMFEGFDISGNGNTKLAGTPTTSWYLGVHPTPLEYREDE